MPKKYNYLVGLDLGSHWTRCAVAIEENSRLRFISSGLAPSRGWARGVIADQDPVLESVEKAIEEAEKNGGMIVEAAVAGVGGSHIKSNVCHSYVNLPAGESQFQHEHVEALVKAAGQGPLSDDRTAVQVIPLEFIVDQQAEVRNPRGMYGKRLDGHVQVISASAQAHNNVRAVVNRAGVVVEETIFEAFAAAYAVLEEQEREMGVAVADMGAGSIDLVAYHQNDLKLATAIPVGGEHFINDVAEVLRTSRPAAEQIIEQYGCVSAEESSSKVMIEVPGLGEEPWRTVPRQLLNEILRARAEETFDLLRKEIQRARLADRMIAGLVLTGGLAGLVGTCDVAEEILNTSCRIGLPPKLEDLPDDLDDPGWATAIGLVLYAQRLRLHRQRRRDSAREWLKAIFE
jgi:cell division protein FtsA